MSNEQPSFAEEIQRRMTLMQAYLDGAQIEIKGLDHNPDKWYPVSGCAFDNWEAYEYRVKPEAPAEPDTIDWSAIHSKYNYMARDWDGEAYLYPGEPYIHSSGEGYWAGEDYTDALVFSSHRKGTLSWDKSLVKRP